jgi:hypothetical protein
MICLKCGKYTGGDSELDRELGICQCREIDKQPKLCSKCNRPLKYFMRPDIGKTLDEIFGCPNCDS